MGNIEEVTFRGEGENGEVRGILHLPSRDPRGGIIVAHGRSNNMANPFIRRMTEAASEVGFWALRFNFRYTDAKRQASRDLSAEEVDLRAAVAFIRQRGSAAPIFASGKSMGARVCARASRDPDVAGMIALGYPLHPMFRPQVRNPPEWPMIVKPALFVQGDQDPFCDLARLREELPRLQQPHELVVIPNAGHSFESKGPKRDTFPEIRDAVLAWITRQVAAR